METSMANATTHEIYRALVIDVRNFGQATIRGFSTLPSGVYRRVRRVLRFPPEMEAGRQIAAMDLRCISWSLRASLEKPVHQSSLKHLVTMPELNDFDPTLVVDCFDVFIGCVSLSNRKVVIIQGLEQLARVSAGCFFRTFHRLSVTDPASSVLTYIRGHYERVFPPTTDFKDLPFHHAMTMINSLVTQRWDPHSVGWNNDRPPIQEHISLAWYMAETSRVGYLQSRHREVPDWILHFVLDSLSLDPLPPASVVADCLTIAAIGLNCNVSNTVPLEDRYVRIFRMPTFLTEC
jgi:hypothetical protein